MRRYSWIVVALLVMSLTAGVSAQVSHEIEDTFYDCALNEVGLRIYQCNGTIFQTGQLFGKYRYRVRYPCDNSGSFTDQWYEWNGSVWVAISGPPSPSC
jgi:hypothetical protein